MLNVKAKTPALQAQIVSYGAFADNRRGVGEEQESEERQALVAEAATEGLYDWNILENLLYVSPRLNRMFGFEGGSFKSETWYQRVHVEDKEIYRQALVDLFRQQSDRLHVEYRMLNTANAYVWVRDNAIAQRDGGGRAIRLVGAVADIGERKRAEEELLAAKRRSEEASKLVGEKNRMLEQLSNQLSKYLSPQVYASIFSGDQSMEIASKRKKLTVLFSDIENFTGTTEFLESEELTSLLNHYLTETSKIALAHGATIDKYVGDAMMMFFGDPDSRGVQQDALACVRMAMAMQQRMHELQAEWQDRGLEHSFRMRIGINTGYCTVGNFGSDERMDYTIIGTEVNVAARLQSHAEPGGILLAHETHALVKNEIAAGQHKAIRLKGVRNPVRTYKVPVPTGPIASAEEIVRKRIEADLARLDKASALLALEEMRTRIEKPSFENVEGITTAGAAVPAVLEPNVTWKKER